MSDVERAEAAQRERDAEFAFRAHGLGLEELRAFVNGAAYGRMLERERAAHACEVERERWRIWPTAQCALADVLKRLRGEP